MKEYLFICTIGPVKDFISQARKSQDLFGGSALLSHLTGVAMQSAIKLFNQGVDIIITPLPSTMFKPNRFVARVKSEESKLKAIGSEIEQEIRDTFNEIGSLPFNNTALVKPNGYDEQLNDYLEIFWLFYPLENGYGTSYRKLFQELASLKNIVAFDKFEETGRKCSVDGKYNVKIYRKLASEIDHDKVLKKIHQSAGEVLILNDTDENPLKIWHLKDGEGLSAVSMTKRIFNREIPDNFSNAYLFPSTVKVALMKLLENEQVKKLPEFISYKDLIEGKSTLSHSDEQLYYQENIKQIIDKISQSETNNVLRMHSKWIDAMKIAGVQEEFTKYYALIRFDGDNMGDWLLGDKIKGDLFDFHKKFTQCINEFATEIDKKIIAPKGRVIYAGGEDFMAMVNIHFLFEVMELIYTSYKNMISEELKSFRKDENEEMTISVGIAIAHYKQPLSMVLDKAKKMEEYAKSKEKNSYAIGIMKHSGSTLETVFPWNNKIFNSLKVLKAINVSIQNKHFSTAFLLNIYKSFEIYGFEMDKNLVISKIKLYVAQSLIKKDEIIKKEMVDQVSCLLELSRNKDFGHMLLILDFLNRKTT